jgi:uncharacterized protein (TIGR02246 family)
MTDDERAIREMIDLWMSATKIGDLAMVLSLMTDDAVFMVPGQEPFGKEAFAARSEGMKGVGIDGTNEVQELQVFGDWAYMRNHILMTATPEYSGKIIRRSGYTMSILRKGDDGKWRLSRDANLLATEPDWSK